MQTTRRVALLAALTAAATKGTERFGEANHPTCTACHKTFEADVPAYALVVQDMAAEGMMVALPGTRLLVCQGCGTLKVVAP